MHSSINRKRVQYQGGFVISFTGIMLQERISQVGEHFPGEAKIRRYSKRDVRFTLSCAYGDRPSSCMDDVLHLDWLLAYSAQEADKEQIRSRDHIRSKGCRQEVY